MKGIMLFVAIGLSGLSYADQRMETVGGFCHFVVNPQNADNEIFVSNCVSSIIQNNDGTGTGFVLKKVEYPGLLLPVGDLRLTGAETGINCVMVDSNGTTYVTQDWTSLYKVIRRPNRPAKYSHKTPARPPLFSITYELTCENGNQQ
jgi:hypothetical protein